MNLLCSPEWTFNLPEHWSYPCAPLYLYVVQGMEARAHWMPHSPGLTELRFIPETSKSVMAKSQQVTFSKSGYNGCSNLFAQIVSPHPYSHVKGQHNPVLSPGMERGPAHLHKFRYREDLNPATVIPANSSLLPFTAWSHLPTSSPS